MPQYTILLIALALTGPIFAAEPITFGPGVPLGPGPAKENSGIVRSRNWPDLFWMINDSGDEPRVYPVRRDGEVFTSTRSPKTPGVLIGGAINVDWEDIAVTAEGEIIVPDTGNNANDRRDLVLYVIDEPAPTADRTTFRRKIFVRYPEQTSFPAPKDDFNFDCEGIFVLAGKIHLLTKHRSDSQTRLYRLDTMKSDEVNDLTFVESFDIQGQVTAADALPDGSRLLVATYTDLWLFDQPDPAHPLAGPHVRIPLTNPTQIEAACFLSPTTALLADEVTARLYEVPLP